MVLGDADQWISSFRAVNQRFTEKIVSHWPACRALITLDAYEDDITNNLVNLLCKDSEVRRIGWPEAQYVPLELEGSAGGVVGKGYIDIALILDGDRDKYVAYECKKLNVNQASLATPYVKDGLQRYIQQQYSRALPVASMLGYVMDGRMKKAFERVHKAINDHTDDQNFIPEISGSYEFGTHASFRTVHIKLDNSPIEINHTFLSL